MPPVRETRDHKLTEEDESGGGGFWRWGGYTITYRRVSEGRQKERERKEKDGG